MQFYKMSALTDDERVPSERRDRRMTREWVRSVAGKIKAFNENKEGVFCFLSDCAESVIEGGVLQDKAGDALKTAGTFLRFLRVPARDLQMEEVTFSAFENQLRGAWRASYLEDTDAVLEKFGLQRIAQGHGGGIDFGENLIESNAQRNELIRSAQRMLADETLTPEFERIFAGTTNKRAFGHPVHYFVETDDREARKKLYRSLLQALYAAGRLKNRRYVYTDFRAGQNFSRMTYEALYKSCIGGAVVVRYLPEPDREEDDFASPEIETVASLCEMLLKYRNQVQTVFCLPRVCEKEKRIFFENLGSVGMVEIREDQADAERAAAYFRDLCREQHVRADQKLFRSLEPEKKYLPDELRTVFDEWFNRKMKTSIFPQYSAVADCRRIEQKKTEKGNAWQELQDLIGLKEAKETIGKALNDYKIRKLFKDKGIPQTRAAMHMVFTGNPGTAKTTAARLFARIMKENGLLSRGHLVEVGRGDLVGKYVGWTAKTVQEKFREAMGGVLFIDEAYSLADEKGGSFGDEAINTIVQEMENRREDLVVIFAGYPREMEGFLNKNPGLRSRIAFHVPFADYGAGELCEIARLMGKKDGYTLSDGAMEKLRGVFEEACRREDFGNGRFVRNVLELARMNQAGRILALDTDRISESVLTTLEKEDVEAPFAASAAPARRIAGFSA